MSRDAAAGEIEKLAHQLGVHADELECVAEVAPEDLRELRRQVGALLFEADRHAFSRMATLANAVPVAVAAKISEMVLPPLLAARTSELFEPHRAAEMVTRLSDEYLANVAAAMDPSRSADIIAALPADRVARVSQELGSRGEWVVMGEFVSFVSPPALQAAVRLLDGEQLLRISFVLDDSSRLAEISEHLTDRQLDEMLRAAADVPLWRELDELLAELGPDSARLAERYALADDQLREAVAAARKTGELSAPSYGWLADE